MNLVGKLDDGLTTTDLVLTITEKLRKLDDVGKFVEFFGQGIENLSLSEGRQFLIWPPNTVLHVDFSG